MGEELESEFSRLLIQGPSPSLRLAPGATSVFASPNYKKGYEQLNFPIGMVLFLHICIHEDSFHWRTVASSPYSRLPYLGIIDTEGQIILCWAGRETVFVL